MTGLHVENKDVINCNSRLRLRALLILIAVFLTGCEGPAKHAWNDWILEREAAIASSSAPSTGSANSSFVSSFSNAPQRGLAAVDAVPVRFAPPYQEGDAATAGPGFDLKMRNPDFPRTYIAEIHIDVASPHHWLHLVWTGPQAGKAPAGPWRSNIGRGNPGMDCDTIKDSNTVDSRCTPKGTFLVAGFADRLNACPTAHYCTWVVHAPRYVALHSHGDIPNFPASAGCVRLTNEVAKLIHNNSIAGVTLIHISGKWTDPALLKP